MWIKRVQKIDDIKTTFTQPRAQDSTNSRVLTCEKNWKMQIWQHVWKFPLARIAVIGVWQEMSTGLRIQSVQWNHI